MRNYYHHHFLDLLAGSNVDVLSSIHEVAYADAAGSEGGIEIEALVAPAVSVPTIIYIIC